MRHLHHQQHDAAPGVLRSPSALPVNRDGSLLPVDGYGVPKEKGKAVRNTIP